MAPFQPSYEATQAWSERSKQARQKKALEAMATTFVTCERLLALLRDDEDFRWEFASNGIDSAYVKTRLGLKGNPRSPDDQKRKLSGDELEALANTLEQLVQGKCTTESVKKGLGNKAG